MTKMQSCTWTNQQYQRLGPPSQSSHAASQHTPDEMWIQQGGAANNSSNTHVGPPQSSRLKFHDYSVRQTSGYPHQAVSSQQPAGVETNSYQGLQGTLRNIRNLQRGNCLITNGHQVATRQDFHSNSRFINSLTPNMTKTITTYPQQDRSAQWGLQSKSANSGQMAHNQSHRQNGTQRGYCPSNRTPSSNVQVSLSRQRNSSLFELLCSTSPPTQQYPTGFSSTHGNKDRETQHFLKRANEIPLNPDTDRQEQILRHQTIAQIAEDLHKSYVCKSNPDTLTMTFSATDSYNSNTSNSVPLNSRLSLSHSAMSRAQHSMDAPQQSSIPNEKLSSVRPNDSSILLSPSRTCTRAIAVVQPLSQESHQVASKQTFSGLINQSAEPAARDESLSHPEKSYISPAVAKNNNSPSSHYVEKPNHMSSSDSAGHPHLPQKQFCPDGTGSELAVNMQEEECVAPAAQQSEVPAVPVNQSSDEDKCESPTHQKNEVILLSSIPTKPWTADALLKLILEDEKTQMELSRNSTRFSSADVFHRYWRGSIRELADKLKTGWYKNLISNVTSFHSENVTSDTVILSEVRQNYKMKVRSHILKDGEAYSEPPYKSVWLDVNKELDDIDKEFGFPWSLKRHLLMPESPSQQEQVETANSVSAEIANEASDKASPQTEFEPVGSDEEKHASAAEPASTQANSPDETTSTDSSDSFYSFEIKVLPPEEAKVIFEQVHGQMQQSVNTDSQPEKVSVEGEPLSAVDEILNDSKSENASVCPIQEVCCISRLMESFFGSSASPSCQCKNKENLNDCTEKTLDERENTIQKEDDVCAVMFDRKSHREEDNQASGREKIENQNVTYSWPEMNIHISQSRILHLSDSEDEGLSSSDTETQPDPVVSCDTEIENLSSSEREPPSQVSDCKVDCGEAELTSTVVAEPRLETEQAQNIAATALHTTFQFSGKYDAERRRTKLSGLHRFYPYLKKSSDTPVDVDSQHSTSRKTSIDATATGPSAPKVRAVQLALFGSAAQDKCALLGGKKRHISSPSPVSDGVPRPPEVISVKLGPSKRKFIETHPEGELPVKQRIHDKWRRSYPPTKPMYQCYLKKSGVTLRKAETVGSTNTRKLPVSSERKTWNWKRNTKHCMSLKRRRMSLPDRLGEEKIKKYAVSLQQSDDQNRSKTDDKSCAARLEKNVLRFSVLPNTFSFKDGANNGKKINDAASNEPPLDEDSEKSPIKSAISTKGTWYPSPERKYRPLHSVPAANTSSLFQEFQKKYKEKTQPSVAE